MNSITISLIEELVDGGYYMPYIAYVDHNKALEWVRAHNKIVKDMPKYRIRRVSLVDALP